MDVKTAFLIPILPPEEVVSTIQGNEYASPDRHVPKVPEGYLRQAVLLGQMSSLHFWLPSE